MNTDDPSANATSVALPPDAFQDVFNLFNKNAVMLIKNLNMALPGFGSPAQVQLPRQVRLGIRLTF